MMGCDDDDWEGRRFLFKSVVSPAEPTLSPGQD